MVTYQIAQGYRCGGHTALLRPKFRANSRAPAERPGSGLDKSRLAHTALRHVCSAFIKEWTFGLHHATSSLVEHKTMDLGVVGSNPASFPMFVCHEHSPSKRAKQTGSRLLPSFSN